MMADSRRNRFLFVDAYHKAPKIHFTSAILGVSPSFPEYHLIGRYLTFSCKCFEEMRHSYIFLWIIFIHKRIHIIFLSDSSCFYSSHLYSKPLVATFANGSLEGKSR